MLAAIGVLVCVVFTSGASVLNRKYYNLPDIIINPVTIRQDDFGGYHYPVPVYPPVFFDETTPSHPFVPPPAGNASGYLPPPVDLEPPVFGPAADDDTVVILPAGARSPQVQVVNMSCADGAYFRAGLRVPEGAGTPYAGLGECVAGEGRAFAVDLVGGAMRRCGVRSCGDGLLCLLVTVPQVAGLRLADDLQLLLQCKPHQRVASATKHFKFHAETV